MQFSVHDARSSLSKPIEAALSGEEAIIARGCPDRDSRPPDIPTRLDIAPGFCPRFPGRRTCRPARHRFVRSAISGPPDVPSGSKSLCPIRDFRAAGRASGSKSLCPIRDFRAAGRAVRLEIAQ
jgi:hypothetical protein